MSVSVCVFLCQFLCLSLSLSISLPVSVNFAVCLCLCLCLFLSLSISLSVSVSVSVCLCHFRLSLSLSVSVTFAVCLCLCLSISLTLILLFSNEIVSATLLSYIFRSTCPSTPSPPPPTNTHTLLFCCSLTLCSLYDNPSRTTPYSVLTLRQSMQCPLHLTIFAHPDTKSYKVVEHDLHPLAISPEVTRTGRRIRNLVADTHTHKQQVSAP